MKRLPQGWQLMEQTLEPGASHRHLLKLSEFLGVMLFTLISNSLPLHVSFLASIALSSYPMTQIPLLRDALKFCHSHKYFIVPASNLTHFDPEGWDGEGRGRGVQDGEHT